MATQIQWISHRGLANKYDENSLDAFNQAALSGFDYLETDLQISQDGHIVLSHDDHLNNISSCNQAINQMTRIQLEQVKLNRGGQLLFLDQFMSNFAQHRWVFDIKPNNGQQVIEQLITILKKQPELIHRIIFLFWQSQQQQYFLSFFPQAQCFPGERECYRANIAVLVRCSAFANIQAGKIYSIPPKFKGYPLLNQFMVEKFHQKKAMVLAYLPETIEQTQLSLDIGVDFILTNHFFPLTNQNNP